MIGLDTNVLVRHLVGDDADQARRARKLIAGAAVRGELLFVSDPVLCELVWVLAARYKVPRSGIAAHLEALLSTTDLAFEDEGRLQRALAAYIAGKGDFADYVIRERALAAGCPELRTFYKALVQEAGFREP